MIEIRSKHFRLFCHQTSTGFRPNFNVEIWSKVWLTRLWRDCDVDVWSKSGREFSMDGVNVQSTLTCGQNLVECFFCNVFIENRRQNSVKIRGRNMFVYLYQISTTMRTDFVQIRTSKVENLIDPIFTYSNFDVEICVKSGPDPSDFHLISTSK